MFDAFRSPAKRAAAAALAFAVAAGCWADDGPTRVAVDGMVIFDRVPLKSGSIQFQPEVNDPKKAFHVGAPIIDGQFYIASDDGLVPGHYKVMIYSGGAAPEPPPKPARTGTPPTATKNAGPPAAAKNASPPAAAPKDEGSPPIALKPVPPPPTVDLIPPRYNFQTILKAEIQPGWFNSLTFVLER